MVPCVTLNTNPPALLGHSKNKSPAIFGIEVRISEHQQALVILKLDIFLEIVKYMPCMELLYLGIRSNPGADYLFLL